MTQPAPGEGKGARAAARRARAKHWDVEPENGQFSTVVITGNEGDTLRYRVRRQPFGFQPPSANRD